MRKIIVRNENDVFLVKCLTSTFKNVPYPSICKALRNKDIRVNNIKISSNYPLKKGDEVKVYIPDRILFNLPKDIKYYYEDDNILVAYKPSGILSNNEDRVINYCILDVQNDDEIYTADKEPTFLDLVRRDKGYKYLKLCHRLDRNTTGLVVFAKNKEAYNELYEAFTNGCIEKEYIAYVYNSNFEKEHEVLKGYLVKDEKNSFVKIYNEQVENSSEITTEYTVLSQDHIKNYAKLNVILHTGRTHQIRAHLAFIDHFIIGDEKYGDSAINRTFRVFSQALIAYKLKFNFTGKLSYLNSKVITLEDELTDLNF